MEQSSRTRLITALVLLAVFMSGALVGAAADGSLLAGPASGLDAEAAAKKESSRRPPMYEQVGPDDQQSAAIATIVQEHRSRMDALHAEFRELYNPRYQSIVHDSREAIKAVFTAEQAAEYQLLLDERDQRRAGEEAEQDGPRSRGGS